MVGTAMEGKERGLRLYLADDSGRMLDDMAESVQNASRRKQTQRLGSAGGCRMSRFACHRFSFPTAAIVDRVNGRTLFCDSVCHLRLEGRPVDRLPMRVYPALFYRFDPVGVYHAIA